MFLESGGFGRFEGYMLLVKQLEERMANGNIYRKRTVVSELEDVIYMFHDVNESYTFTSLAYLCLFVLCKSHGIKL